MPRQYLSTSTIVTALALVLAGCSAEPRRPLPQDRPRTVRKAGGSTGMVKTDTQDARPDFLVNIVGKIPEMARPVMIWLHAVKHRRPDLLQQAFSSRVKRRPKFQSRTWEETLLYFDRLWREKFGNWDTSDFHFYGISQREGEPNRGSVLVKYEPEGRTAQTTQVAVVREGDQWFVDRW